MTENNQSKECQPDIQDDDLVVGQVLASVVKSSSRRTEPQEGGDIVGAAQYEISPEDLDYDDSSPDQPEVDQDNVVTDDPDHKEPEAGGEMEEKDEVDNHDGRDVAMDTEEQLVGPFEEQNRALIEDNDQEGPEKEEIYVVEKILDKQISSTGVIRYLVKWMNYPPKDNSWEPMENLVDCRDCMIEFELERAKKLAEKLSKYTTNHDELSSSKTDSSRHYEINDIMNLIKVGGERYFLISLANSTKKAFVRASLANRIFPTKVIDFYIRNMRFVSNC